MKVAMTQDQKMTYAAALFEARGTATVGFRPSAGVPYRQFRVRVRADHEAYTDLLIELFGGAASPMGGAQRKSKRVWYEWRLSGREALKALETLEPYLLVRGPEIRPFLAGHVPIAGRVENSTRRRRVSRPRVPRAKTTSRAHASA